MYFLEFYPMLLTSTEDVIIPVISVTLFVWPFYIFKYLFVARQLKQRNMVNR